MVKHDLRLLVGLTPGEKRALEALAVRHGVTQAAFMRQLLRAEAAHNGVSCDTPVSHGNAVTHESRAVADYTAA